MAAETIAWTNRPADGKFYNTDANAFAGAVNNHAGLIDALFLLFDGVQKVMGEDMFEVTDLHHGEAIAHGLGTRSGLSTSECELILLAFDSTGALSSGISVTPTSDDLCTVSFDNTSGTFTGKLWLKLVPKP